MDRTFNFFKNKTKKQNTQLRVLPSKSNSSKASNSHTFEKHKPTLINRLTKKQRELREAIEFRFQKSKQNNYKFELLRIQTSLKTSDSHSSQKQEYAHLKDMQFVDLKQYHRQQQKSLPLRNNSSLESKRPNIRLKIKDSNSNIFKTEASLPLQKSPYVRRLFKQVTPTKPPTKAQEWKLLSIELQQGRPKSKNKPELKINSHRSYNMQQEKTPKTQPSSSMNKYNDKVPKLKDLAILNMTKF